MHKIISLFRTSPILNVLFLSNIFLSFHYFLIYYVNSTFLSLSFSEIQLSALYIIGATVETTCLLNASRILNRLGSYTFIVIAIFLELVATSGLVLSGSPLLIGLFFILHMATMSTIVFNLDILVESVSADASTGSIRASYLTITNIVVIIAPSIVALLLRNDAYAYVYSLSALFLIPLYFCIKKLKHKAPITIPPVHIKDALLTYISNKNLRNIFAAQFLLQLFYAFMGIYMPLYLQKYIGFSWSEIGIIFTIMLLPFVMFELPVGAMADKKYGEKEFLSVGQIIMGVSTLIIAFISIKSFFLWAAILFVTRIGASFVEITAESFFFKHVKEQDGEVISFFRITRPLSFIVAPILATIALQFIPFQYMFIMLGSLMIIGVRYSLAIQDTK